MKLGSRPVLPRLGGFARHRPGPAIRQATMFGTQGAGHEAQAHSAGGRQTQYGHQGGGTALRAAAIQLAVHVPTHVS